MHRIQLKGPWEYHPLTLSQAASEAPCLIVGDHGASANERALPPGGNVKFPASWHEILGDYRGIVTFRRPFNRPTNLSIDEQVDLVLEGITGSAEIRVNGSFVACVPPDAGHCRFEITPHLRPHNELRITVVRTLDTQDPCGLWGVVSLEILQNAPEA